MKKPPHDSPGALLSPSKFQRQPTPGSKPASRDTPTPGYLSASTYDAILPPWRAAIRRTLVKNVEWESRAVATLQKYVRTPWLDAYFVYTSSLGTHTFFMTVLPALFFFGYGELGRGLLMVLAFGVYVSSFIKDLICSPRPLAPPVARLTIGSHHLEYGFPSTHSTNSVSIALFFLSHLRRLTYPPPPYPPTISPETYTICIALLAWYAFSIVFGRLYTGMHSFSDCAMGVLLGAGIWAIHEGVGGWVELWVEKTGWAVPALVIPLTLIMVNQHPQPVDDCPCFEDAIAFVSVVTGSVLARWTAVRSGFGEAFYASTMPGGTWEDFGEVSVWWSVAGCKMIFGIAIIFTWRLLAKSFLRLLLPPLFRLLAQGFTLPNRRFYTPATEYGSVPAGELRAVPSVVDLPRELDRMVEAQPGLSGGTKARKRNGARNGDEGNGGGGPRWELERATFANGGGRMKNGEMPKHYDADVLTKVVVYAGIAVLACEALPITFEVWGWGVRTW